jgi:hypothetical protein
MDFFKSIGKTGKLFFKQFTVGFCHAYQDLKACQNFLLIDYGHRRLSPFQKLSMMLTAIAI